MSGLPKVCPKCGAPTESGYGLAGGGMGEYVGCSKDGCDYFEKRQDEGANPAAVCGTGALVTAAIAQAQAFLDRLREEGVAPKLHPHLADVHQDPGFGVTKDGALRLVGTSEEELDGMERDVKRSRAWRTYKAVPIERVRVDGYFC